MLISDKYIDYSQNGRSKTDSPITFYMKDYRRLYGTLCFNNMIPVPDSEIINYDLNDEGDLKYKLLVFNELYFIRHNKDKIERNAKNLYESKTNWLLKKDLNVKKANYICSGTNDFPEMKNIINQQNIFNEQIEKNLPDGKIVIINSFPFKTHGRKH